MTKNGAIIAILMEFGMGLTAYDGSDNAENSSCSMRIFWPR